MLVSGVLGLLAYSCANDSGNDDGKGAAGAGAPTSSGAGGKANAGSSNGGAGHANGPGGGTGGVSGGPGDGGAGDLLGGGGSAEQAGQGDKAREAPGGNAGTEAIAGAGTGSGGDAGSGECATASDPFSGVWTSEEGGETWTVTNDSGCSTWIGKAADTVCDSCVGTYEINGLNSAQLDLSCTHESSCSVSPDHMDTGTLTRSGCSITYSYSYGTGSNVQSANWVSSTAADVCSAVGN